MEIFNIQIFGDDIKGFTHLSCSAKKEWIKTHTNQSNDVLIDEFLQSNYVKKNVCCAKCGEKYIKDGNISEKVSNSIKSFTSDNNTSGDGERGTNKRRKQSKTT